MTTYDLDTLTLANTGEDATDENRLAYSAMFLNAYNEAYAALCGGMLRTVAGQTVQLDADKRFRPEVLSKRMAGGGIVAVKPHMDYLAEHEFALAPELAFRHMEDGSIAVPGAQAEAAVYVVYRSIPELLVNATPTVPGSGSAPVMLPEQYHGALASFAAASFFRVRRKFERMQVWMEAYLLAVRDLQCVADSGALRLANVYSPMP